MRGKRRPVSVGFAASVTLAVSLLSLGIGGGSPAGAASTTSPPSPTLLPGTYQSLTPARILDTSTGTGAPKQPLAPGSTIKVAVLGQGGLPASGVGAVAVNLTATGATATGYLTAYPDGASRPTTTALGFAAGSASSDLAFLKVAANGAIDLYNGSTAPVQVAADVKGYFVGGTATVPGAYVPLTAQRALDTSSGLNVARAPIAANGKVKLKVRGLAGVPKKGADTVTLNVTVTTATTNGWLAVYSGKNAKLGGPTNSFTAGRPSATLVTVDIGDTDSVVFTNHSTGTVQIVADVEGYTLAGPTPLFPTTVPGFTELGDNQPGVLTPDGAGARVNLDPTVVPAHGTVDVAAPNGFPFTGVGTAVLELTIDGTQTATGSLTAYPTGTTRPSLPDLSFGAGQSVTNLVLADVDRHQHFTVYNGSAGAVRFWVGPLGFYNQQRAPSLSWVPQVVDPPRGSLTDISCPVLGSCTEVDQFGNAIAQTATGWAHPVPLFNFDDKGVQYVSCPTTTFCAAAGIWGVAVEKSGTWSPYVPLEVDGNIEITGVSCGSGTFCVATDTFGQAFTWNGTTWSVPVIADPNGLSGISCPAAGVCFGVDSSGGVATLAAGRWHVTAHVVAGSANRFNGDQISCPNTTFCEATSSQYAASFSGGVWHASTPISFGDLGGFKAHLSCASATLCLFAGSKPQALAWTTTDGHTWTSHPSSLLTVQGVDCVGSSCLLVGSTIYDDSGSGQTQLLTGSSWSAPVVSDPLDSGNLSGLACPTTTWCLAEDGGYYLIDQGGTWTWPAPFPAGVSAGTQLQCLSPTNCTVNADHAVATWNGSSWSLGPKVTNSTIRDLSCPTTTFCLAVDITESVFVWNGSVWKAAPKASPERSVSTCVSSTFCMEASLVNGTVMAYRWNGSAWSSAAIPGASTYPEDIYCSAVGSCVLLMGDGTTAVLDGTTWTIDTATQADSGGGAALGCLGTSTCEVLLGQDEVQPSSDGWTGIPQRLFLPGNVRWGAVSCAAISHCVATNNMGIAYTGVVP